MHRLTLARGLPHVSALVVLVFVALVVPTPSAAGDKDPKRAQALFGEAKAAYERGDHKTSIAKLREAFELYPDPMIRVSIAKRYLDLGEPELAEAELQRVDTPNAKVKKTVAEVLATVRDLLAQPVLVTIDTDPSGARVTVDAQRPTKTPARVKLTRGVHRLAISLSGHVTVTETLTVSGTRPIARIYPLTPQNGTLRIQVRGVPEGKVASVTLDGQVVEPFAKHVLRAGPHKVSCRVADGPAGTLAAIVLAGQEVTVECALPVPIETVADWRRPVGWTSIGAGTAAVATGVALLVLWAVEKRDFPEPQYTIDSQKPLAGGLVTGLGGVLLGLGTYWVVAK